MPCATGARLTGSAPVGSCQLRIALRQIRAVRESCRLSTVIAVIAIVALRYRLSVAHWVVWLLVIVTVVDLTNAGVQGATNELFEDTFGVPWVILVFYVPALWVTAVMMAWLLVTRRAEPLAS